MGWLRLPAQGGPGQVIFAINNACNASCGFCSFNRDVLKRPDWRFAPLEDSLEAFRALYKQGIRYAVITGGEPMMHPDFFPMLSGAKREGLTPLLVTNGSLLTLESCQRLKDHGLSSVFISIDAHDALAHENNRGLPKVCGRILEANACFKRLGIQSTASMTMSRLIKDYTSIPHFLRSLGFDSVTFSYPLTNLESSFLGHRESDLVSFSSDELDTAFQAVLDIKKKFHVVNPTASINDMRRFLNDEKQLFDCLGGYRYFYMDWDLKLWRCHHWKTPIGDARDFDETQLVRDGCQACMIDCMRDPSTMQHLAVAAVNAGRHLKAGRVGQAAAAVFNRRTAVSAGAVWEQLRWISRI